MRRRFSVYFGLLACLVGAVLLALSLGTESISFRAAFSDSQSVDSVILFTARLPRTLMAVVAGAGLAAVGVAFQALLRNPLAEPYVLGVSGGAALGATLALVAGVGAVTAFGVSFVPVFALLGGLGATALVYAIARAGGEVSGTAIILAGVIVNAVASALITFVKSIVSASKAQELLFWLMGFLDVPSTAELASTALWASVGVAVLLRDAGRLNILALGRLPAQHLGVEVQRLERRVVLASSVCIAAIVSVTGLIGFVGLIVPHVTRRLLGPDHRHVLPGSLILGAGTLVACDVVARVSFLWLGTEPPVGAVTALIGGPLFLWILRQKRNGPAR